MRNYLTETQWSAKQAARPAYILGLRDPENGACYTWTDQSAAENTATPVFVLPRLCRRNERDIWQ